MTPDDFVYHATYLWSLPGIAVSGLVPGHGESRFGGGYGAHSQGRVFFSAADGARYWFNKLAMAAPGLTDHPEEGWIPVLLRIERDEVGDLHDDPLGTRDSFAPAFYVEGSVDPDFLEVWDGVEWLEVGDADFDAMLEEARQRADVEEDEETGEEIFWMDDDVFWPEEENL